MWNGDTYCRLSIGSNPERWSCSQLVAVSVVWDVAIEPVASDVVFSMVVPNGVEKQSTHSN